VPGVVLGWDMTAALAMAAALGVDPRAAVEFLPVIEAVMVRKLNEQMDSQNDRETRFCPPVCHRRASGPG
jgi:thioesterase domain-containing protein